MVGIQYKMENHRKQKFRLSKAVIPIKYSCLYRALNKMVNLLKNNLERKFVFYFQLREKFILNWETTFFQTSFPATTVFNWCICFLLENLAQFENYFMMEQNIGFLN